MPRPTPKIKVDRIALSRDRRRFLTENGYGQLVGYWMTGSKKRLSMRTSPPSLEPQKNVSKMQPIDTEIRDQTLLRFFTVLIVPRIQSYREMDWHKQYPTMRIAMRVQLAAAFAVDLGEENIGIPRHSRARYNRLKNSLDKNISDIKVRALRIIRPTESGFIDGQNAWKAAKASFDVASHLVPPRTFGFEERD